MEEYRDLLTMGPVFLDRNDLIELERILLQDLSTHENCPDVSISIEVGDGPRRIEAKSMAELLKKTLPKTAKVFSIHVMSWAPDTPGPRVDASFGVELYHNFAHLNLSTHSETLFLGKMATLLSFFRRHRPWHATLTTIMPICGWFPLYGGVGCAIVLAKRGNYFAASVAATLAIVTAFFLWLVYTARAFPFIRIRFDDAAPRQPTWELAVFVLNILLLLATIASIIVGILKP